MIRKKEGPRRATDVAGWCDGFERGCRERGIRVTAQRLAVYRALAEDPSHPSADAVYARVRPRMPGLSQATVYRILESLEREGFIRRVSTTGAVARFDANRAPHQHLVCRVCGRMTDVDMPALSAAALTADALPGFVVEELDVRVVGRCTRCVAPATRPPRAAPGPEGDGRPRGGRRRGNGWHS